MTELKSLADQVKTSTNNLDKTVNDLGEKETAESKQNAASAVIYAEKVRESLNTNVNFVGTNPTIGFVSDLSGNNWLPGGLTPA